ncbi:ubiquitin fusion-degradation protein [Hamiltosporidium magnivora]|uniref:Ubiquitin fusion-degradation protein n=1 Tax=Hamiltosporidium magnivora TaxID=148818 RepID=A0A4Q9KXN1_9MICR|nr:ubiquitin fusion-degradation protein [Hamiltosporidium magnivora]
MFFDFFRRNRDMYSWKLSPKTFEKGNKNNYGGKVLLPQLVLEDLVTSQILPPYTFEISHNDGVFLTHCGVLEFTSHHETITVPEWMYQQLCMDETLQVVIKYKFISVGTFVKLLPHSVNFLEIESPKIELEKCLRNYQVLTQGDEILCDFEEFGDIRFTVTSVGPAGDAIYIIDTDLSVDFQPPIGYAEKLENERTVMKYVEIVESENGIKYVKMKKLGLCLDFGEIETKTPKK